MELLLLVSKQVVQSIACQLDHKDLLARVVEVDLVGLLAMVDPVGHEVVQVVLVVPVVVHRVVRVVVVRVVVGPCLVLSC